jgi:acyl-CoA thioesterase
MKMNPLEIVQRMLVKDTFTRELGVELLEIDAGRCALRMHVQPSMTNGFGIAHGGITYSLSDSAMAFASNAHGNIAMSIETSISHLKKVALGDVLTAETREISHGKTVGRYEVVVTNSTNEVVSVFKGTVLFSQELWEN